MPEVAFLLLCTACHLLTMAMANTSKPNTVMLPYGGGGGAMGKVGSFERAAEWFGFKKALLEADASKSPTNIFEDLKTESDLMKAAIVGGRFPVPRFKKDGTILPEGTEMDEIDRLHATMEEPNKPDKVPRINEIMEPSSSNTFESQGCHYHFYGPFTSRDDLIAALKDDPMLKPVHDKWSKFEPSVLDAAFKCERLYLQIRWEGWFVRPVRELTEEQFADLLNNARSV